MLCTRAVWSTFAEIHSTHWNFQLEFVTLTSQQTRDLPNLSYDCDLWIQLVFRLLLVGFRLVGLSVEAKDYWTFSHCFHRISFCSRVYMYVHGMRYLHHEVHELDGYKAGILEDFGIFFEMCSWVSRLNFTRERSFKDTPLDWALANVFEDIFSVTLSGCEQYKTLVARSTNDMVI